MAVLSITEGSVVRIRSRAKKDIIARAYKSDSTCPISNIKMNRCFRQNLQAYLGQIVLVEPYMQCEQADSVVFAPIADTVDGISGNFADLIKDAPYRLADLPVMPNFILPVYACQRVIEFKVVSCSPSNTVLIGRNDVISCQKQAVERNGSPSFSATCYDDIGGLNSQIDLIRQTIELPLNQPQIFDSLGFRPFKGILISAPSGCGKSLIGSAISNETGVHFYRIPGYDLLTKTSQEATAIISKFAELAVQNRPSIVFIDDFDVIIDELYISDTETDTRLQYGLLGLLDKMFNFNVVVIATTHDVSYVPEEFKVSNRLAQVIDISLPGRERKIDILKKITRCTSIQTNAYHEQIVDSTDAATGSELKLIYQKALIIKGEELAPKFKSKSRTIQINDLITLPLGKTRFDDQDTTSGAPSSDTFRTKSNDPFATPSEGPFTSSDPFAQPSPDPFAQHAEEDARKASGSADPFAANTDPFGAQQNTQSPFDPFGPPRPTGGEPQGQSEAPQLKMGGSSSHSGKKRRKVKIVNGQRVSVSNQQPPQALSPNDPFAAPPPSSQPAAPPPADEPFDPFKPRGKHPK